MTDNLRRERVWAEIDLDRIARNYHTLRTAAGSPSMMVVLKADGYGLGALPLAKRLVAEGTSMIGVGDSTEAIELRKGGIEAPLIILGAIVSGEADLVVAHDIAICIHSTARSRILNDSARRQGKVAKVHLMVDTGMGRLGVTPKKAVELAEEIARLSNLELAGVATHYASAASVIPIQMEQQFHAFAETITAIRDQGIDPGVVHASSSACLFSPLREHFDMIRVGIALFGINPGNLEDSDQRLEPAVSLRTQIIFLKDFPEGSPIGYHRTYVTKRPTRIATLPIGYNDGLFWQLGNRGTVLVRGHRAPIVGAVSMDYTTIDVGKIKDASVGDEVTIFGRDGDKRIRVEDVAQAARSIPYEVVCRLSRRVVRIYQGEDI